MPFRSLDELTPADAASVGGKAWNCARLKQAGFPVPDGLVVPANAADAEIAALDGHPWFTRIQPDERFAVRSSGLDEDSAGESFAGIHDTQLNVGRPDITEAVRICRASGRSDRARAYRQARGLSSASAHAGVLIQRMIQPIASGVAFTVDPVTAGSDEIVVNAAPGLGVAVVDGQVDPDEIRVRKRDGQLVSYQVGGVSEPSAATLGRAQVVELTTLLTSIERHYGSPQDIEWCFDGTSFWILQSRPITNLGPSGDTTNDTEWTRANLAEVLPEMTSPQALAAIEEMLNIAERRYMGRLTAPYDELGPMVKAFYGRLYFNLTQLRHICTITGTPPAAALRSLGHAGEIGPDDEQVPRPRIGQAIRCLPDFVRILGRHLRPGRILRAHEARINAEMARLAVSDPTSLPDDRVWATLADWQRRSPETIEVVLIFGGVLFHELRLRTICQRVQFPFERLLYSHLAAGERSVSAQQAFDLVALADVARTEPRASEWLVRPDGQPADLRTALAGTQFLAAFDGFLDRYGHRGLYESDWARPRYREDPSPLLDAIRMHLRDGHDQARDAAVARVEADASTIRSEFERTMSGLRRWTLLPRARRLLTTIKQYYMWREQCRSDMIRVAAVLRRWHLVLADRFVERGWIDRPDDYFFLHFAEIAAAIDEHARRTTSSPRAIAAMRSVVAARRAESDRNRRLELPMLMRESELARLIRAGGAPESVSDAGEMRGTPVSRGSVESDVVVITDPGDFGAMKRGAILVARATDPSWTPLFTLASGVIVEVGGVLSHASTIAREYGLPALANVRQATKRLKTGDRILLNATEGWARRVLILAVLVSVSTGAFRSAAEAQSARAPRIVALGDSLTSGHGIGAALAYPAVLQQRLLEAGFDYRVVNAGVSGDTSAGAVRRLARSLMGDVRVLIVAIGANDGLRGVPVATVTSNLNRIIGTAHARGISVVLCGMETLPSHGPAYAAAFHNAFPETARRYRVTFVPFLLQHVITEPAMLLPDRAHPNAAGAQRIADNVWPYLESVLQALAKLR